MATIKLYLQLVRRGGSHSCAEGILLGD